MLKKYWRRPIFKLGAVLMFFLCLGLLASGASHTDFFRESNRHVDFAAMRQRGFSPMLFQQKPGQSDSSDPTPVQEGVLSDKEKKHSMRYEKEYAWRNGRKLRELPGTAEVQITLLEPDVPGDPDTPNITVTDFLRKISCKADAVVIGTVQTKASQITEDGRFAFSQYQVAVNEIIKNNRTLPIVLNGMIDITGPGGSIKLNGRVIRVYDRSFPILKPNSQYLVFLQFIAETGSYKALPHGDYDLVGEQFAPLFSDNLPEELRGGGSKTSLLELVRNAISTSCN